MWGEADGFRPNRLAVPLRERDPDAGGRQLQASIQRKDIKAFARSTILFSLLLLPHFKNKNLQSAIILYEAWRCQDKNEEKVTLGRNPVLFQVGQRLALSPE